MKKYTILLCILFSCGLHTEAQVDLDINLALGLSTPQLFKDRSSFLSSNKGLISPVFGICTQVQWNGFVFETGVESSQTKIKTEYKDDITKAQLFEIERVMVSRFSIPFYIGYNLKKHRITPMIGLNKNISNLVHYSLTTINKKNNFSNVITNSVPNTYYLNEVHNYEFLARIDFELTDRLCLGVSVVFRKAELQKRYFVSSFFGTHFINDEKSYKRDCRILAIYRL